MRRYITTSAQLAEEFAALVRGFSVRQLANAANCSTETAKSWKAGKACPQSANLINLCRHIPHIRQWMELQIEDQEPQPLEWKRAKLAAISEAARGA